MNAIHNMCPWLNYGSPGSMHKVSAPILKLVYAVDIIRQTAFQSMPFRFPETLCHPSPQNLFIYEPRSPISIFCFRAPQKSSILKTKFWDSTRVYFYAGRACIECSGLWPFDLQSSSCSISSSGLNSKLLILLHLDVITSASFKILLTKNLANFHPVS